MPKQQNPDNSDLIIEARLQREIDLIQSNWLSLSDTQRRRYIELIRGALAGIATIRESAAQNPIP